MPLKEKYSLYDHNRRFDTDQKCHDHLVIVRWQGRPQCPKCENDHMNYYLAKRNIYKCSNCYKQFSVIKGTIFERSKIPLKKWFLAIYLMTTENRGIPSVRLAERLGIGQHAAWYLMQRLREAMKDENDILLDGMVEADETFVGPDIDRDTRLQRERAKHYAEQERIHGMYNKRDRNQRKGVKLKTGRKIGSTKEALIKKRAEIAAKGARVGFEKTTAILGMTEQRGRIVMKIIGHSRQSISRENIIPLLRQHISPHATFLSDQLHVYRHTNELFREHLTVNHNVAYVQNGIHINNIENAWMHLKKMVLGTYFHISKSHFHRYLDENTYRWNRRKQSKQFLFDDFIPLSIGNQISYNKLIEKPDQKEAA